MESKLTLSNVTLIILAIFTSVLLLSSKVYYWDIIDLFALPFDESPDLLVNENFSNFELQTYLIYYEVIQYVNVVKEELLDSYVTLFGYDIYKLFFVLFGSTFLLCAVYVIIKRHNKISYIPILCCFLGGIIFTSLEPAVSVEKIGQAFFEKNDFKDPNVDYADLLRNEKYDELNKKLHNSQKSFENNTIDEYQYVDDYTPFKTLADENEVYLDRWLTNSTDKQYSHMARGIFYEIQGWDSRGGKYSKDTTEEQFTLMREYFSKAVKEHKAALDINKKSLLSYESLAGMRAAYDFGMEREDLFNSAMKEFPTSHYLPLHYMLHLQPKWGGSYSQMRKLAKRMRSLSANEPILITLSAQELTYRAYILDEDKDKEKKVRLQRFAMFYGTTVQKVVNITLHYDENNDNSNGLRSLEQGLKFYPENPRLLLHRASHFSSENKNDLALADLKNISPDDIKNAWEGGIVADTYTKLGLPENGIPYYIKSINISSAEDYPFNRLYWLAYKGIMSKEDALPYMKQWTETHPTSSDAWISYGDTLKKIDQKLSVYAYKKFIEYANRNNKNDMVAIKYAKKYIETTESKM